MLNHRPEPLDLAGLDDLSLLQSLEALPLAPAPSVSTVTPEVSAVTGDDPLAGLHLGQDGGFFGSGFSIAKDFAESNADFRLDTENAAADTPDFLAAATGTNGPASAGLETGFWDSFDAHRGESASIFVQAAAADDGLPSANDLIFLDLASDAKGGVKGKPSDGGSDGGDTGALSEYISGEAGAYNIEIDFKGSWTVELQQAFIDSADYLSSLIVGDIADVFFRGKVIDDIRIDAKLGAIDGEGGILGQAGPTAIRTDGYLPATAVTEFDIADAALYNGYDNGRDIDGNAADVDTLWDVIVLHEMMHSIGFGTIWSYQGLISGAGTDDPRFTGENAMAEYEKMPEYNGLAGVAVEQDGGAGTRDSHWDEQTFGNEIMTGYINISGNYLSDMSIASLGDLGYEMAPADDILIAQLACCAAQERLSSRKARSRVCRNGWTRYSRTVRCSVSMKTSAGIPGESSISGAMS